MTFTIDGLDPCPVVVEADLRAGLPAFTIVGLADRSVSEARERVRAAIQNSGFEFPMRRVTVNLAPAHLRKAGPASTWRSRARSSPRAAQLPARLLDGVAVFGELSLTGEVRRCRRCARGSPGRPRRGARGVAGGRGPRLEAQLVRVARRSRDDDAHGPARAFSRETRPRGHRPPAATGEACAPDAPDLADVRGQAAAIAALTVAAAGGHNLLLIGPPGTGKTMLARRMPSILPAAERRPRRSR